MIVSVIVAMTDARVIGKNNQLPWRLKEDLARFKQLTMGHPILMGRKTFESIGKPLPGRRNIVLSRDSSYRAEGVTVVSNLEEAFRAGEAAGSGNGEVFVIGGAALFQLALPIAGRIYLTLIHHGFDGDIYFPAVDFTKDFATVEETHHRALASPSFDYSFVTLERNQNPQNVL